MFGVRTLSFEDIFGVFHQRSVKEAKPEVLPKRPQKRDVAICEHVAGMAPFDRLFQIGREANTAQLRQTLLPILD